MAVKALAAVATKGDESVIEALVGLLRHSRTQPSELSLMAVKALASVAMRGDESVIEALVGLLRHSRTQPSELSLMAVKALASVAMRGDESVIEAIVASGVLEGTTRHHAQYSFYEGPPKDVVDAFAAIAGSEHACVLKARKQEGCHQQ